MTATSDRADGGGELWRRPTRRRVLKLGSAAALGAATTWWPALHAVPASAASSPAQPFASYWFPDSLPAGSPRPGVTWKSLKTWDPATDPDVPFNRGSVPLAGRFAPPGVNPSARSGQARVTALVAFAPTSGNPSQGGPGDAAMAFTYWEYVDELVFWGGSAGEGLILAPNPTVIDAAHRHGVRVLGNIFLPPNVFGGQIQWVRDLVQQDASGTFPLARKLVEVAELYGFDGWFVNQETAGGDSRLADQVRRFLISIQDHSPLFMTWYDAMVDDGGISYQDQLDSVNQEFFQYGRTQVSNSMFLNFGWSSEELQRSRDRATALGRNPYDLAAGVDVQSKGYGTTVNWDAVFPAGAPDVVSLGFYRPDWTFASAASMADFFAREQHFWVGPSGDPQSSTPGPWPGIASFIADRSPILSLPFATAFNTGQGRLYAVDGSISSTNGWNNLGLQDLMPSYRWIVRGPAGTGLVPSIDPEDSYQGGGASLLLSGPVSGLTIVPLYATRLHVTGETRLDLVTKAGQPSNVDVGVSLEFRDAPGVWTHIGAGQPESSWTTRTLDLSAGAGRTVATIALRLAPAVQGDVAVRVGLLAVRDGAPHRPDAPSRVSILQADRSTPGKAALRVAWRAVQGDVRHYAVFRRNPDGSRTWLGATGGSAYFVPEVDRVGAEPATTIEVVTVSTLFAQSAPATVVFTW